MDVEVFLYQCREIFLAFGFSLFPNVASCALSPHCPSEADTHRKEDVAVVTNTETTSK